MAQNSQVTPNDRRLKKINAAARHLSTTQAEKDKTEKDIEETQKTL